MNEDRKERVALIRVLYETLSKKTYSVESTRLIVGAFDEVSLEELRQSVPLVIREFPDIPPLSDLIDFIKSGHIRKIVKKPVQGKWEDALDQLDKDERGL